MKKIGILTYFGDLNVGTNLQAYSTLNSIRSAFEGYDIEIINYQGWRKFNKPYRPYLIERAFGWAHPFVGGILNILN